MRIILFLSIALVCSTLTVGAQTVSPARQSLNKIEVSGLNLATSIPEKQLREYWTTYLSKYGKVKGKRGVQTVERAYIPSISSSSLNVSSAVTSSKNISTLFLALNDGGKYISSSSDSGYLAAEQFLKEFLTYATAQEELRLVKEDFSKSQDEQKKLVKEKDRLTKEIGKTEKDLENLRKELAKKESDLENYNTILQNKQKGVEDVESRKSN